MVVERRLVLLGGVAVVGLGGCMDRSVALNVSARAASGMNLGPDGAERPLTLSVLQLNSADAFDGADFFALQDPATALGGELVRRDQIVVAPNGTANAAIAIEAQATLIGIVAGYRTPAGKQFRAKMAVPGASRGLTILVEPSGISLNTV